jgi:HTH-type transcriptional regulator / antitoxin MqsA
VGSRICADCGIPGVTRFEIETFVLTHAGLEMKVQRLSGWRCDVCEEIEFDAKSADRYTAAGDELVLRARQAA